MNKIAYKIYHFNNTLELYKQEEKDKIFSSFWFMEFGKISSEIRNSNDKLLYSITKKFQFWKWRMVYLIAMNVGDMAILISQNKRNTIFKIELLSGNYEIKIHYKNKKSIYKNKVKIAEFDETLFEDNYINLLILNPDDVKIVFLLYACLFIGETNFRSKSALKSMKELEVNLDPWL